MPLTDLRHKINEWFKKEKHNKPQKSEVSKSLIDPVLHGGSIPDPDPNWLLITGNWNDTGIWDDYSTWNDGGP